MMPPEIASHFLKSCPSFAYMIFRKAVFSCTTIILFLRAFRSSAFCFFICKVSASGLSERVALHASPKIFSKVFGASLPHSKIFQVLKDEIISVYPLHTCLFLALPNCT